MPMNVLPTDLDLTEFIGLMESQYIKTADHYRDDLKYRFKNGHILTGDKFPWLKTHDVLRMRPKELSIWCGINGHRKSMLLGQVMLWLPSDTKILMMSLEMSPVDQQERMVCQALGGGNPTEKFIDEFVDKTNNFHFYDQVDSIPSERILGVIGWASKNLGVKHVVVDSLMKCVRGAEDWNAQKDFTDKLSWLAKHWEIHIHLVHHVRKGKSENDKPNKFDVKGAGEITDMADNVLLVHANKAKQANIEKNKFSSEKTTIDPLEPDQTLTIAKQRSGKYEGTIALYFDEESLQFRQGPDYKMRWRE